jgi:outer membrane receptor protein involved in Fe transport
MGGTWVAHGQQQTGATQSSQIDQIVITGSRIVRRDLDAPSPIVTLDTEVFEQSSSIALEYVLNEHPQFSPERTQFTTGEVQPTATTTPGASTLNMRGLGSERSLILLGGRRAQPVNAAMTVDVNTLPAAAISGVEIITGGAAATYGPDAMAGVVNFQLRRDFEGINLNYQTGWTDAGDGEESRVDGLIGGNFDGGRGNAMFGVGYATREKAYMDDRDFYLEGRNDPSSITNYARVDYPYWNPTPGNLPSQAAVDQVLPVPGQSRSIAFYANPGTGSVFRVANALEMGYDGPTTSPYKIRAHNGTLEQDVLGRWVSSPMTRKMAFGRAVYDLNDSVSVFVQGTSTFATVDQFLYPTPVTSGYMVPRQPELEPAELRILLDSRPQPNANYHLVRVGYWFPHRGATTDTHLNEMVAGFEGKLPFSDWTWEMYHQTGRTEALTKMNNFINIERLEDLAVQPGFGRNGTVSVQAANSTLTREKTCTSGLPLFQPFLYSPPYGEVVYQNGFEFTQDCIDAITAQLRQRNVIEQRVTEGNFQGKIMDLQAGELRGAFGLSNRVNYSLFEPDEQFVATDRAEGETTVNDIYAEVLVPVIGKFDLEFGARYSDFETGDDWSLAAKSYKALFNWRATDSVRFRGGWQRANRVPNVAELYGGRTRQTWWWRDGDACMNVTQHPWGNVPSNPNRAQVQELCRQLIYQAGGVPGQTDFDIQGADNFPSDGRALPFVYGQWGGGNPRLDAEIADTYTAGLVWRADNRDMTIAADWYEIEIENVVDNLGGLSAYEQCFNANGVSNPTYSIDNPYCQAINRNPLNSEPFDVFGGNFNFSSRHTSGIDISLNWSAPLSNFGLNGPGEVSVRSSMNKLLTWKQPRSSEPDAPLVEYAGYGTRFDYQMLTTFSYNRNALSIGMNWRYLPETPAEVLAESPNSTNLPTEAYHMFNLHGSWRFNERIRLRGGIDNFLDKNPPSTGRDPYHPAAPSSGTGVTQPATYDALGRRFFVALGVDF